MNPGTVWYNAIEDEIWCLIQDYSPYPEWVFETPDEDEWFVYKPLVDEMVKARQLVPISDAVGWTKADSSDE